MVGGGTLERYGPLLAWERERHYSGLATVPARHTIHYLVADGPAPEEHACSTREPGCPGVAECLRVIGQTVLEDQRNEPLMIRYEDLAAARRPLTAAAPSVPLYCCRYSAERS